MVATAGIRFSLYYTHYYVLVILIMLNTDIFLKIAHLIWYYMCSSFFYLPLLYYRETLCMRYLPHCLEIIERSLPPYRTAHNAKKSGHLMHDICINSWNIPKSGEIYLWWVLVNWLLRLCCLAIKYDYSIIVRFRNVDHGLMCLHFFLLNSRLMCALLDIYSWVKMSAKYQLNSVWY